MFNQGEIQSGSSACKPDPEDMLQRARKRKEDYKGGVVLIKALSELPISGPRDQDEAIMQILGHFQVCIWQQEKEENRWLQEIDKD